MTNFTPDMIAKAKQARSPEELLELAKAEQVGLTAEETAVYFEMLHPKTDKLSDDDLDNVSGGGCKTKVNNRNHTVVTANLTCFTGQFESNYESESGRFRCKKNNSNLDLREFWFTFSSDDRKCGRCRYLEFKGGTGYCSKS